MTLTFDPEINGEHCRFTGSLNVKFHDDWCKGKAIMQHKPFSVNNAL